MTDKKKKYARDIQDRTGWAYSFCLFLNSMLGYEAVSQAVDDADGALVPLGERLNRQAKEAQRRKETK